VKTWRIFLAVCLIFAAGAVTGGVIARRISPVSAAKIEKPAPSMPPHADQRKGYLERLDAKLKLSPDQKQQVDRIIKESQERMKQLWQGIEPQAKEEYKRTRKEISEILSPEQQEIYKTMRRDREKGDKAGGKKEDAKGSTNLSSPSAKLDCGNRCS
jgi:hypothetical protein